MLLGEEEKQTLVNQILAHARQALARWGVDRRDAETGLVTRECRIAGFILIEHQRQQLEGGTIRTNGLDLWQLLGDRARKCLSVSYVPFRIKVFEHAGKAAWIETFMRAVGEP